MRTYQKHTIAYTHTQIKTKKARQHCWSSCTTSSVDCDFCCSRVGELDYELLSGSGGQTNAMWQHTALEKCKKAPTRKCTVCYIPNCNVYTHKFTHTCVLIVNARVLGKGSHHFAARKFSSIFHWISLNFVSLIDSWQADYAGGMLSYIQTHIYIGIYTYVYKWTGRNVSQHICTYAVMTLVCLFGKLKFVFPFSLRSSTFARFTFFLFLISKYYRCSKK